MKFLLGYNMKKNFCEGWDKNLVMGIFPEGGRLSKACADDAISVK